MKAEYSTMKKMHETALANHCRFTFETLNPKLHVLERGFSIILSVNSGYE